MGTIKKEPVKLRRKQLANGNQSLYLDVYLKGKRKYEFLNLYLIPERNAGDRAVNKRTLQLADEIRVQRLAELQRGQFSFAVRTDKPFILDWLEEVKAVKESNMVHKPRWSVWHTLYHQVERYDNNVRLDSINVQWIDSFRAFLEGKNQDDARKLTNNYIAHTMENLSNAMNMAVKKGIIDKNPFKSIARINLEETERVYLTLDELKLLSNTECKYPELKRAFLFSCLTGLRRSDIEQLQWKHVSYVDGYCRLTFVQWKTRGQMYLDISEQAASYLGDRGKPDDYVFDSEFLKKKAVNPLVRDWAASAGIDKHITYHSSRHTFAVLMITLDTDLYTISKLLGHADIKTTQIYAKVVDKVRREAVSKIPKL